MRLFLAINISPAVRERIYRDYEPIRAAVPGVTWVRSELLHFTVKFLGEVPEGQADTLRLAVGAAVSTHRPFSMELGGLGSFPNFVRPRVVWIGVRENRTVFALAEDVEEACQLLGFERDARGFSPHLTLGRIRRDLTPASCQALERTARSAQLQYLVDVETVDLMRSELTAHGSRYSVLASLPLTGSG